MAKPHGKVVFEFDLRVNGNKIKLPTYEVIGAIFHVFQVGEPRITKLDAYDVYWKHYLNEERFPRPKVRTAK